MPVKIEDRENELLIFAVLNRGTEFRLSYLFFAAAFLVVFLAAAFFFGFFLGSPPLIDMLSVLSVAKVVDQRSGTLTQTQSLKRTV